MPIHPVVLAGGKGTRLWPLSRADRPKQFLPLFGGASLLQRTILRHAGREGFAPPWIVCNDDYRFTVADEVAKAGIAGAEIVLEPAGRNTAPAIAAAAALIRGQDEDALLLVLPSDHLVEPDEAYFETLREAFAAAGAGRMVAFGVTPSYPETGYGYIEADGPLDGLELIAGVRHFVEKPPSEDAARMVAAGGHYWNAGFFAFSARHLLEELTAHAPEVVARAEEAAAAAERDLAFVRLGAEAYAHAPDISIDYALFEHTAKAAVAPITCRWSDIGSWRSFWDAGARDDGGVLVEGDGLAIDTENALVVADGLKVVTLGVRDLAVVATDDAVLVASLGRAQDVKAAVAEVGARGAQNLLERSRTSYRPWGGYKSVIAGDRFQVKLLFVLPGKQLSLQRHHHRSEHWVVVRGTAEITIGEEMRILSENESVYIPVGTVHRLANPGRIMLELIEVQTGSYLEEDDIVRLEDSFGRC